MKTPKPFQFISFSLRNRFSLFFFALLLESSLVLTSLSQDLISCIHNFQWTKAQWTLLAAKVPNGHVYRHHLLILHLKLV